MMVPEMRVDSRSELEIRHGSGLPRGARMGCAELTRTRWSPQAGSDISSRASWFMTTIDPSET
jgi:hypothetical protein